MERARLLKSLPEPMAEMASHNRSGLINGMLCLNSRSAARVAGNGCSSGTSGGVGIFDCRGRSMRLLAVEATESPIIADVFGDLFQCRKRLKAEMMKVVYQHPVTEA